MKIGILGSGDVGRVLASAFLKEGHDVMIGTREIGKEKLVQWKSENAEGMTGSFEEAANFGETLVLATVGSGALSALGLAGKDHLSGKVIIDATNPIVQADNGFPQADHGVLRYFTTSNESLMEQLQHAFPDARFVKAFNSVGNAFMYKPSFPEGRPTMFICGNDALAKETVSGILGAFGWDAEDMGMAESARPIEALCQLWCAPGFLRNQWTHAFKLYKIK
ncbi:MAG: NAD(P)-binding domain-containing protein [Saprospiraceae bacterium]|nr:NAD(P)-binding domain-containing protein [Saprospiraceae bacterium]